MSPDVTRTIIRRRGYISSSTAARIAGGVAPSNVTRATIASWGPVPRTPPCVNAWYPMWRRTCTKQIATLSALSDGAPQSYEAAVRLSILQARASSCPGGWTPQTMSPGPLLLRWTPCRVCHHASKRGGPYGERRSTN